MKKIGTGILLGLFLLVLAGCAPVRPPGDISDNSHSGLNQFLGWMDNG